jgi:polar amino acid transport system substrate-binding protein
MLTSVKHWAVAAGLFLLLVPSVAEGACTRALNVPVGEMGITITVDGGKVGGIFPDMMRAAGQAEGCDFNWLGAPRARLEAMFEAGQSDLLLASSRTPRRDQFGYFVPMVATRATLISIDAKRAPVRSLAELLARRELRVAVVRGYDYGDAYNAALQKLAEQNRLIYDTNAPRVARLIHEGIADVTIMTGIGMAGAITSDDRLKGMMEKLRLESLEEIGWTDTGVYISKLTVGPQDTAVIEKMIQTLTKKRTLWDAYKRYYPPALLVESIRLP